MGSDPAPFFANLFLYRYESRWLNKMKKQNNVLARKFGRVFRFIDDLLAVNDGDEFEKYHSEIYPPELELKQATNEQWTPALNIVLNSSYQQILKLEVY